MKKLKPWQIVLLVIFYPVGIVYLIVWLVKRNKSKNADNSVSAAPSMQIDESKLINEFSCSVWGTTYANEDGTNRQLYIDRLNIGDDLFFHPAPTDEYPDTIGVFTKNNEQIGFIGYKDLNKMRGLYLHNNASVSVESITHSERGIGVTMHIKIYE